MLKVENISKSFTQTPLLKSINFDLDSSELVGLVGPSGAGKSVLLKIIAGVMEPDFGDVTIDGEPAMGANIGFLFQGSALFDSLNVLENTAFPLLESPYNKGEVSYEEAMERSYELLKVVGLKDAIYKLPGQLSGGMQRRAGIARALVSKPDYVFLDDPTGGLDPITASVIMELIASLNELYKPCFVLVSHDLRRLLPNVKRVLALFDGVITYDGDSQNLYANAPERVTKFLETRYDFTA